jgi:hypothetical protein
VWTYSASAALLLFLLLIIIMITVITAVAAVTTTNTGADVKIMIIIGSTNNDDNRHDCARKILDQPFGLIQGTVGVEGVLKPLGFDTAGSRDPAVDIAGFMRACFGGLLSQPTSACGCR